MDVWVRCVWNRTTSGMLLAANVSWLPTQYLIRIKLCSVSLHLTMTCVCEVCSVVEI